jgi:LPS export ABC transporter protein LptC
MNLRRKIFLIFCFLFLSIINTNCNKNTALRIDKEKESGSQISLRKFSRISYNEEGKKQWKLNADESFIYPKEDKTIFYGLDFNQYDGGKLTSELSSDRGEVNHTTKKLNLNGNIFLITPDRKSLKTQTLEYDINTEELTTDDDVKIYSSGTFIAGKGLRAKKALNQFTVLKPTAITQGGENPFKKDK